MFYGDFEGVWKDCIQSIEFDPEWNNGTDYYNGAMDVKIKPGSIVKSRSPEPNNRRILLIGTSFGTIVLFERYTPIEGKRITVVGNMPSKIARLMGATSEISETTFTLLINFESHIKAFQ